MEKWNNEEQLKPVQETVGTEIINVLDKLANVSEKIASRTEEKLHSICQSACSTEDTPKDILREYPPLFNDIREKLTIIDNSFDRINNVLNRVEV